MSRSGYDEDYGSDDPLALGRYRQAVHRAMMGKRGQKFFKDLAAALDAMPEKRLIADDLIVKTDGRELRGEVCAIGALGLARNIDMSDIDPENAKRVGEVFDIAESLAREVVFENDEGCWKAETPEDRWQRMRDWVAAHIVQEAGDADG